MKLARGTKTVVVVLIVLVVVATGVIGWRVYARDAAAKKGKPGGPEAPAARPVPVTAATVVRKAVPLELSTFGMVEAVSTVSIRAQVTEVIGKIHFKKGENVKKGQLLFTINRRTFEVAVEQAEANLARDTAQRDEAQKALTREEALLEKGISSQDSYDKAKASKEALAAAVRADEAAVKNAKLQLDYCFIRSPIDGNVGNTLVNEGNLVKANDIVLVVINQIRPIEVFFSIPQSDLPIVRKTSSQGALQVRATIPKEGSGEETGTLTFINNAVDESTGTIQLGATFANENERLCPGQYVQVSLVLAVEKEAIVVPAKAVQVGRDGKYVFVIRADKSAEFRPVTVARTVEDVAVITRGLEPGEQVITEGQFRLVPGAKVEIKGEGKDTNKATDTAPEPAPGKRRAARVEAGA